MSNSITALVTGANKGIGFATAHRLAELGLTVLVGARDRARGEAAVDRLRAVSPGGHFVPLDVTDEASVARAATDVTERFGRLDVLVNNAGGSPPCIALAVPDRALEDAFHFNVTAAFHLAREAAPHLAKSPGGGAIVNTSSALSHLVDVGFVAYGTAKAALNHMTRLLAAEWAPKVRVNAVAAGATVTDALEAFVAVDDLRRQMEARTPMARLADPEDIAAAILYLASPAASFITGKVLEADGGTVASNWPFVIPGGL